MLAFSDLDLNNVIDPATEVLQQNHFYSFGMRMEGTGNPFVGVENKYKFSGKELDDELGLNEYDFGARLYDPVIARWGCIDPMADAAPHWTPFRYAYNNPVNVTDLSGMFEDDLAGVDSYTGTPVTYYNKDGLDGKDNSYKVIGKDGVPLSDYDKSLMTASMLEKMNPVQVTSLGGVAETPDIVATIIAMGEASIKAKEAKTMEVVDNIQTTLDMVGLVPVLGEVADGANALVYLGRGDYGNASLSAVAMVPFVGWGATGAKLLNKGIKTFKGLKLVKGTSWVYGTFKSQAKWAGQLAKRGWTAQQITEAVTKGKSFNAVNMVNKANSATRYVHPITGQSVVIDDITKELLHIGGPGFKY